jgi:thioredoxin-like negative regulator of GroEL
LRVDADDNPHLSLWYGVQSIPTLLFFVAGNLREKLVGTASKEAISTLLRRHCDIGSSQPLPRKD